MGGMLEAGQLPESSPADVASQKVVDIVPDGVIGHWAFHDVVIMDEPGAAAADEVEPLIGHAVKFEHAQGWVRRVSVDVDHAGAVAAGPLVGLVIAVSAVEAPGEILGVPGSAHLGKFNGGAATVVEGDGHRGYLAQKLNKRSFYRCLQSLFQLF